MTSDQPHHSIEGLLQGRFNSHLTVACSPQGCKQLQRLDLLQDGLLNEELAIEFNKVLGADIVRGSTKWEEPDGSVMELAADRVLRIDQESFEIERECALDFQVCCCEVNPEADAVGKTLKEADVGRTFGIEIIAVKGPGGSWAAPDRDVKLRGGDWLLFRFRKCRFTPPCLVVSKEVYATKRLTSEYHLLVDKEVKWDNSYICLPLLQQRAGSVPRKKLKLKDLTDEGQMGDGFTLSKKQLRNLGEFLFGASNYDEVGRKVLDILSLANECGTAVAPISGILPGPTVLGTESHISMVQAGQSPSDNDLHGVQPQSDVQHSVDLRAFGLNIVAALHSEPPKVVQRLPPASSWFECPICGNTVLRNTTRFLVFIKPGAVKKLRNGGEKLNITTDVHPVRMREDNKVATEKKVATMVLLDTSNSMHGSSGFQGTSIDNELQQLETLQKQGWDDTAPDDNSSEKLYKTIEAFRKHPNLQGFRAICQNHQYLGSNPFARAAEMELIASGILQELCCLEWTKPNVDRDLCRIYTLKKETLIKILLEDPAASPLDLTGKWCIEITKASPTEVSKKKKKKYTKKGDAAFKQFAMPVGEYNISLRQSDNQVTSEGKDWKVEGEVEDQSVKFWLIKNGHKIAQCLAVISDAGMRLQAGHWTGAAIGSGEFVGIKAEVESGLQAEPPREFLCPITQQLMEDPVTCADGHSYESHALEHWARTLGKNNSPLTGEKLPRLAASIYKNHALRKQIEAWRLANPAANSGSKHSKQAELQRAPPFQIFVKTLIGKTLVVDVDDETRIIELKNKIMESTSIPCHAQRLIHAGKDLLAKDATVKECQIQKHACLQLVMTHGGNATSSASISLQILVTVVDKRNNENMSFLANPYDTVETILLKCWCAKPNEIQPSKVTLWTGMEEDGDKYFTGIPQTNLSTKLNSLPLQVDEDCGTWYSAKLEMGMTKRFIPEHLRRELSRLQCAKQWLHAFAKQSQLESVKRYLADFVNRGKQDSVQQLLHAFVNRRQAYNYQNEMGLASFGDTVEVVSEISSELTDYREKVGKIDCSGDTSLYDALDKAVIKLQEWRMQQSLSDDVCLRVVVLSDGQDNRSRRSALEVQRMLQKNNIKVDAIAIGGDQDKRLYDIIQATGGSLSQPKSLADLLKKGELASS